jgi:hypothetical protein
VLPTLWCWCDLDQTPHVLRNCTIPGSDLRLPFACPADYLVDPNLWELWGAQYRVPGFLDVQRPRLAPAARGRAAAVATADVLPGGLDAAAAVAALGDPRRGGGAVAPVAQLRGMRPAAFRGFGAEREDREFDAWFDRLLG